MSTSPPMPGMTPSALTPAAARAPRPAWLREPLLHFVLLGAALFVADHYLAGRAEDPRRILITQEADKEMREVFKSSRGREPTVQELAALRQAWLDNEVLYREGLALQVDKGDIAIRDRVIFKALSVVDASTKLPALDDKVLQAWFESNRSKYDEPARFDFQEAVLAGDNSEAAVRSFAAALNIGAPGDAKAALRVFKGRPHSNLVQSYGAVFAKALEEGTPGEWRALKTGEGWRAMRLDAVTTAKPAQFEALRGVVLQDWSDAILSQQRSSAVHALAQKYKVAIEADSK